jgi:hypothetical protein
MAASLIATAEKTSSMAVSNHVEIFNRIILASVMMIYFAAGMGAPKSTLGAVEIYCSFSTVKLGLV